MAGTRLETVAETDSHKTFVLTSLLESEKYLKLSALKDGGTDPSRIEEGNPSLWTAASGLVGYWPMDEGSGSVAGDLSGNGNTGTLTVNPYLTWQSGSSCKLGNCLKFDVAGYNYVSVPDSSSTDANIRLTLSAWVYPTSNGGSDWYSTVVYSGGYYLSLNDNGGFSCYWYGTTPPGYHSTVGDVPLNKWTHIACAWNGSVIKQYVDGNLVNTIAVIGSGNSAVSIRIGAEGTTRQFDGFGDEMRIYRYALSPDEIKAIYTSQK